MTFKFKEYNCFVITINLKKRLKKMVAEGFEPSKRDASDLKSLPFDQTRERYHGVPCGARTHDLELIRLML